MVSYGLKEGEEDTDDSFDHHPQETRAQPRKRTYPDAFLEDQESRNEEIYPYNNRNAIPMAIEEGQEWVLPTGITPSSIMDCFKTALGWAIEYGGKFLVAGKYIKFWDVGD